jgi:hypothetical protein
MFFKTKLLTNQVILTLFLGMILILFPFLILDSHAAESDPQVAPISAPQLAKPASAPSAPSSSTSDDDDDSGTSLNRRECEIA